LISVFRKRIWGLSKEFQQSDIPVNTIGPANYILWIFNSAFKQVGIKADDYAQSTRIVFPALASPPSMTRVDAFTLFLHAHRSRLSQFKRYLFET
jgi:hypothetical protein